MLGSWFYKWHRTYLFRKALSKQPKALLDGETRSLVSWSPKSACTVVLMWHLQRLGLLGDAKDYHRWPHRYRQRVLYRSSKYAHAQKQASREGPELWTYVKVVRDPWGRCISSYRQALKTGYANQTMSKVLGRAISHEAGFSFETFLEFLGKIDLTTSNPHHRFQAHDLDGFDWDCIFLVKIDDMDLASALSYIDDVQSKPRAFESELLASSVHSDKRRYVAPQNTRPTIRDEEIWRHPLCKQDLKNWPQKALFESVTASQTVKDLYHQDYQMLDTMGARSAPMPEWVMKS